MIEIDLTYNLCDSDVSDISVPHPKLIVQRDGKIYHPHFLMAVMIHQRRNSKLYEDFAHILTMNSSMKNIKFVSTDLDLSVYNGFKRIIPGLCNLICTRHKKKR